MHALIHEYFNPAFGNAGTGDSAIVDVHSKRLAYTTDSYVVSPLFFPGGNIGDLAVCGTVNDLSVAGAVPLYLTAGFIIEEGFPISDLKKIIASMAAAAKQAGITIVAGDTKVVNKGKADGVFINTSGIGSLEEGIAISPANIQEGDAIIISGELGNHGVAILAERNGLTFDPPIASDTRPLNSLVKAMFKTTGKIRFMRDPTRGGLATTLKEAALESGLCIRIREQALPIPPPVKGACSLLGLDPLYVANEGILVAVVDPGVAAQVVLAMRSHEHGRNSVIIGTIDRSAPGMVLLETSAGGSRIIDMLPGEMLPRIC
jgi:hydrogenase expression/formation protein HypE